MADNVVGQIAFELVADREKFDEELGKLGSISENISNDIKSSFNQAFTTLSNDLKASVKSMEKSVNSVESAVRESAEAISGEYRNSADNMIENIRNFSNASERSFKNTENKSKKSIKSLAKNFISSAANIKAAFDMVIGSIRSVTSACSQLMSVYKTQIEAESRLAATMRNSTSASDAQIQSVKELASSLQELGVVGDEVQLAGAQELATYVSDVESIKTILPVLDDMIAQQYGFSASTDSAVTIATMLGKVLQGQTSALSRYGYSFDEAQEKILKYGTEQERVATLAEVVNESVSGVNKSLADTPTGKVKQLSNDFGDLKETLGKLITDIIYPLVKQLDVIVKKLNEVFTAASEGIKNLLGIEDNADIGSAVIGSAEGIESDVANIVEDTQKSIQDSIDDTKKALQEAQGYLAGYDNLNVLTRPDEDNDDGTKELPVTANEVYDVSNAVDSLQDNLNSVRYGVFEILADKIKSVLKYIEPLATAVKNNVQTTVGIAQKGITKYLDKYGDKISEYSGRIDANLKNTAVQTANGITNILSEATASQELCSDELSSNYADLLGGASIFTLSFADVFTSGLDIVSKNFEDWTVENRDTIGEFFDGINGNAANFMSTFGGILEDIGTKLTEWWDNSGSQAFDNLTQAFFDVQTVLLDFWNNYITPFIDYITDSFGELWDNHLSKLWDGILEFVSSLMDTVSALWNGLLRPIYDTFVKRIMPSIMSAVKSVWDIISDVVGMVIDVIRGVIRSAQGLLDFITGIFTGDLEKCVKGFAEFVQGICQAIWGVIKGVLNVIIDALNTVWSAFYGVLKSIVDGIGDFAGLIGDLFGQDWGFSMPDEPPKIPRLAKGGLVTAPTLAIVGDNKNAKNDPEVVSPLSKLQGMIDSGSACDTELLQQILMYLKMLYEFYKKGGGDVSVVAELDGDVVFKDMVKRNNAHKRRHGKGAFVR